MTTHDLGTTLSYEDFSAAAQKIFGLSLDFTHLLLDGGDYRIQLRSTITYAMLKDLAQATGTESIYLSCDVFPGSEVTPSSIDNQIYVTRHHR